MNNLDSQKQRKVGVQVILLFAVVEEAGSRGEREEDPKAQTNTVFFFIIIIF